MMEWIDLNSLWFILLGVLLGGYAILDGFDLGVGILHLIASKDHDRRIFMNSIGPLWDGNEVWLVTFGGALFAAFPEAYATLFSAFYTPFMLVLLCLITRAVSLEFRSKQTHRFWRQTWDVAFFASSLCVTLLFGVAVGSGIAGIPINANYIFTGNFWDILHPYSFLTGVLAVSLFALHGAIYLFMKTEDDLQKKIYHWIWHSFGIFLVLYIFTTMVTLIKWPHAWENFSRYPWAWGIVVLHVLAIGNIPRAIYKKAERQAFLSSCLNILGLTFLFGLALFPDLVPSTTNPEFNLNIHNAASSAATLKNMTIIALMGMPCVLAYTTCIYWVFRGKVKLDQFSY